MATVEHHAPQVVVVTGDVTMDWNIVCARPAAGEVMNWSGDLAGTRAQCRRGGAALLADLIEALGQHGPADGAAFDVRQPTAPSQPVVPDDPRFHHAYRQWNLFPPTAGASRDASPVWRISEWLGLSPGTASNAGSEWDRVAKDAPEAQLVLLDDAALGFRDRPELWPQAIHSGRPWIVLKMSRPLAQGKLWQHVLHHHADRLVLLTTVDDLRQTEVQISPRLSWEQTAQDLVWELVYNPAINAVSRCAHVVISLGAAGAMLMSSPVASAANTHEAGIRTQLFFDPELVEGAWERRHPGTVSGSTTCVAAALARELAIAPEAPDMARGVQRGLAALRVLHKGGNGAEDGFVTFPTRRVVETLMHAPATFAVAPVPDPGRNLAPLNRDAPAPPGARSAAWTILEDRYTGGLETLAHQIVLQGVDVALQQAPFGRFGALLTVDRREIEGFRSLSTLVSEYCSQPRPARPLSIAVFGAPGAGKSFGVTQVASALLPGQIEKLTFNLSQLESPVELFDAFHRARDVVLSGRIPLVFWDEFDTALEGQALGWLRHFLAPMQDGAFQERQIVHPIGRAIFVFAGGTSETMAAFDKGAGDAGFRAAKGPDFVSRLKGFVDIVGPNPKGGDPQADPYAVIRRAILLRSLLQSQAPQIFQRRDGVSVPAIDSGVLRALLEIPAYKHGARSMESIVATSVLAGKIRFERSALPSEAQINLHADGSHFLSLVHRLELAGDVLERLAEAAYEVYRNSSATRGAAKGGLVPDYAGIPEADKEKNRQTVRDLPARLARAGYVIRPARSDEPPAAFHDRAREALAESEHERWVKSMLASGWRHGPRLQRGQKIHPALVPWHALPEKEKQKNRALVDGIPHILARAGYTMMRAQGDHDGQ